MKHFQDMTAKVALILAGVERPSLKREEGQTLVEYALIIGIISIGVMAAMLFLRDQITTIFNKIGDVLTTAL